MLDEVSLGYHGDGCYFTFPSQQGSGASSPFALQPMAGFPQQLPGLGTLGSDPGSAQGSLCHTLGNGFYTAAHSGC